MTVAWDLCYPNFFLNMTKDSKTKDPKHQQLGRLKYMYMQNKFCYTQAPIVDEIVIPMYSIHRMSKT